MRYAVLSDIHGNLEALTAVLTALASERIDQYLCVGDMVGYGADPVACLERLQAIHAVMVAGNHESACIGRLELEWFNDTAGATVLWTRDQLSVADLDILRRLPLTAVEEPFTLVHASLRRPERFDYLVDAGEVIDTLSACRTLLCVAGHTHLPCVVEYDRERRRLSRVVTSPQELAEVVYQDRPETWRYLINPGSVGQPRDGDPRASVAVVDTESRRIQVRRIPYDIAATQEKIRRAGLLVFLADRLAAGR